MAIHQVAYACHLVANHLSNYIKLTLFTEISGHSRWKPTKWEISVIIMHQIRHSIVCCAVKISNLKLLPLNILWSQIRSHFRNKSVHYLWSTSSEKLKNTNPQLKSFTNSTGHPCETKQNSEQQIQLPKDYFWLIAGISNRLRKTKCKTVHDDDDYETTLQVLLNSVTTFATNGKKSNKMQTPECFHIDELI